MRVFLDTNVILEFFIEREDVRTAAQLFNRLKDEKAEMYMSVGSFYTMMFLIDKYLRKELGQPGDVPTTYADATALERDFGFTPKITLREGLRRFAQWYKEYYNPAFF